MSTARWMDDVGRAAVREPSARSVRSEPSATGGKGEEASVSDRPAVLGAPGEPIVAGAPDAADESGESGESGESLAQIGGVLFNRQVSARYWHLAVSAPTAAAACAPGQFFHLRCGDVGEPLLRRPMSVYQIHRERGELHFLYAVKGAGTTRLAQLQTGDSLDMAGPLGHGFTLDPDWRGVLLVARGVGLATLGPVAAAANRMGIRVTAVLSARTERDVLSESYMRVCGARTLVVTDDAGTSGVPAMRELVAGILGSQTIDALFTCGSQRLTALLQEMAAERGLPGQAALEEPMGCGLGVCYCCVRPIARAGGVEHLRVCRDGPVFPLAEVITR
ncbi:MAG: dihydroorotate dehydrogenase electron transfer subunit [Bacilli bacterium]